MEQWLARTERTFAPIRFDIKRCVSAGIIRSISETRYHEGFSSQAGRVILSSKILAAIGFCTTARIRA
jgi:hypothetical protein